MPALLMSLLMMILQYRDRGVRRTRVKEGDLHRDRDVGHLAHGLGQRKPVDLTQRQHKPGAPQRGPGRQPALVRSAAAAAAAAAAGAMGRRGSRGQRDLVESSGEQPSPQGRAVRFHHFEFLGKLRYNLNVL